MWLCMLQVSVMQQELQDLQLQLIKTSANTEQLLINIEQDTIEVEAKRKVDYYSILSGSVFLGSIADYSLLSD